MAEQQTVVNERQLMEIARMARKRAYCPYSHFAVGAALLCEGDRVYTGCNVENASYGASICAERVAFDKAVSQGERKFVAIAIAGGNEDLNTNLPPCPPCGTCRQVMREFTDPRHFKIFLNTATGGISGYLLRQLLPMDFGPANLETKEEKQDS